MRKFITLFSREIRSYFYSPIAYIVLVFFLLLNFFFTGKLYANGGPGIHRFYKPAFFQSIV